MGAFEQLGPALRVLRRRKGLKQREVESMADLSKRTLTGYETSRKRPEIGTLEKILEALDSDALELAQIMKAVTPAPAPPPEPKPEADAGARDLLALLKDVIQQTLERSEEEKRKQQQEQQPAVLPDIHRYLL